jgi:ABC-type Fe3+/spermidine/putrescine transport system ATPase subunit
MNLFLQWQEPGFEKGKFMLKVKRLRKKFTTWQGGVKAVFNVNFEVKTSEFFTLLGLSGCGKRTTMRCIAGLEKPRGGE